MVTTLLTETWLTALGGGADATDGEDGEDGGDGTDGEDGGDGTDGGDGAVRGGVVITDGLGRGVARVLEKVGIGA